MLNHSLALFDVALFGSIITRSVSEGPSCVPGTTSAVGPSLTRRVVKNTANHGRNRSKTPKCATSKLALRASTSFAAIKRIASRVFGGWKFGPVEQGAVVTLGMK
jgi:hypothetical protein